MCGEGDRQATRLVRGDELGCAPLDDLDLIGAGGDRRATPSAQVFDHLALRQYAPDLGVEFGDEHGRPGDVAWPPPLAQQLGRGLATAQSKRPGLVAAGGSRHDVAAAAQLLEGEQPDRLLAERAVVTRLRRLEQVAGNVTQPVRGHPAAHVVDGDHRPNTLAAQQDADARSGTPASA